MVRLPKGHLGKDPSLQTSQGSEPPFGGKKWFKAPSSRLSTNSYEEDCSKTFFSFLGTGEPWEVCRDGFSSLNCPLNTKLDFEWFLCNFCFLKICTFPMTCTFSYIENILDLSAHFLMWKGQVSRFPLGHRGKEPSPQTSHGSAVPWIIQLLQLYQMQCMIFNVSLAMC